MSNSWRILMMRADWSNAGGLILLFCNRGAAEVRSPNRWKETLALALVLCSFAACSLGQAARVAPAPEQRHDTIKITKEISASVLITKGPEDPGLFLQEQIVGDPTRGR